MASSIAELRDWDPDVLSQNFNVLTNEYREWRDDDKYMLFQFSNYDTNTVSYKLVKGSKRGNDVYNFRLREKLRPLLEVRHLPGISGSFLTLTCDIKEFSSWSDAWPIIIKEWNRFLTWLKKHYKGSLYGVVRCFEATKRGYPPIHAVLLWKGALILSIFQSPVFLMNGNTSLKLMLFVILAVLLVISSNICLRLLVVVMIPWP